MNIDEFKAAIRPQIVAQIHDWLWVELDMDTMKQVAVGFQKHARKAFIDNDADTSMRFAIELLPPGFDVENSGYIKKVTEKLLELFFIHVDRYNHIDTKCITALRIRAYQCRLKNILNTIARDAYIAHTEPRINSVGASRYRKQEKENFQAGATGELTRNLIGFRFA